MAPNAEQIARDLERGSTAAGQTGVNYDNVRNSLRSTDGTTDHKVNDQVFNTIYNDAMAAQRSHNSDQANQLFGLLTLVNGADQQLDPNFQQAAARGTASSYDFSNLNNLAGTHFPDNAGPGGGVEVTGGKVTITAPDGTYVNDGQNPTARGQQQQPGDAGLPPGIASTGKEGQFTWTPAGKPPITFENSGGKPTDVKITQVDGQDVLTYTRGNQEVVQVGSDGAETTTKHIGDKNFVVHRSHAGAQADWAEERDSVGNVVGKRTTFNSDSTNVHFTETGISYHQHYNESMQGRSRMAAHDSDLNIDPATGLPNLDKK